MNNCESCGEEFELTRPNKRFCSEKCRKREERRRYRQTPYARKKRREQRKKYKKKYRKYPYVRVRRNVSKSIRQALKRSDSSKNASTFGKLPYTPLDLKEHLENQFDENMNWDNYGSYWHIDHIVPQAALSYDSMDHPNFLACWDLQNLQPLSAEENTAKGSYHDGRWHKWDED